MKLPVDLTGPQAALLNAVLVKGGEELLIIDNQNVNGSPLLVLVARGDARDYVRARLHAAGGAEAAEPAPDPDPVPAPPAKVVPIQQGVNAARPAGM